MDNKTILLVEDDFLNRRLSRKILMENEYIVLEAKNANEALIILRKEVVHFVILDINLGEDEQDGISLGQHIKDKFAIPFIYLTAYENPEIIKKAVETSPYSYLTKPFKKSDLIASIEIAIRQSAHLSIRKLSISVKDGEYTVELPINDINYIESEGNYLLFYTENKVYKSRSTLKKITDELSSSTFIQTHRAYVVNKNKVQKLSNKSLMISDKIIPISENYLDDLKRVF